MSVDAHIVSDPLDADLRRIGTLHENAPGHMGPSLAHALRLAKEGKATEARDVLIALSSAYPDNPCILLHLGGVQLLLDDRELALEAFRRALFSDPVTEAALTFVCAWLYEKSNLEGLLSLSGELQKTTLPLLYALDLAWKYDWSERAAEVAWSILSRDPGSTGALKHLLQTSVEGSTEYLQDVKAWVDQRPFDFEAR